MPIVVLDVSDGEALELAIIENVQRTDLNPLEEATGYQSLANEFNHSQDDIAKIVGKSRSHIANTLRLLNLPERVKAYINSGKLTAGHARMLVGQPNAEELADQIVNQGLNVRQVEAMARKSGRQQARGVKRTGRLGKDADTEALENRLTNALGLAVTIDHRANGGGMLQVRYRTLEQLDDVVAAGAGAEDRGHGRRSRHAAHPADLSQRAAHPRAEAGGYRATSAFVPSIRAISGSNRIRSRMLTERRAERSAHPADVSHCDTKRLFRPRRVPLVRVDWIGAYALWRELTEPDV